MVLKAEDVMSSEFELNANIFSFTVFVRNSLISAQSFTQHQRSDSSSTCHTQASTVQLPRISQSHAKTQPECVFPQLSTNRASFFVVLNSQPAFLKWFHFALLNIFGNRKNKTRPLIAQPDLSVVIDDGRSHCLVHLSWQNVTGSSSWANPGHLKRLRLPASQSHRKHAKVGEKRTN